MEDYREIIENNKMDFKVFCLEAYKIEKGLSGKEVYNVFKEYGIFDYINNCYDVLRSFGKQYLVEDIEGFIEARRT